MNVEVDFENKTTKVIVPWLDLEYHVTINDEGIIIDAVKYGEVETSNTYGYGDLSSYSPESGAKPPCECDEGQGCCWDGRHE